MHCDVILQALAVTNMLSWRAYESTASGLEEERGGNGEAEGMGGLEVDHPL